MSEYVLARIQAIQQELEELKKVVAQPAQETKRRTQLSGLWAGVQITEEDLADAKQALFRNVQEI